MAADHIAEYWLNSILFLAAEYWYNEIKDYDYAKPVFDWATGMCGTLLCNKAEGCPDD